MLKGAVKSIKKFFKKAMAMKDLLKKTGFRVICMMVMAGIFTGDASASELLNGKQFLVLGFSTGDIPFYDDVFSFEENGSFDIKKMASYGSGEYYELLPGFFYFYFANRSGIDIQSVAAFGINISPFIFGAGYFMIDYEIKPTVFVGVEVFQE